MSNALAVVGLTDIGKARARNEDSLSLLPELGAAVVADGMGGHPGGDVASRIAVETASEVLASELPSAFSGQDPSGGLRAAIARTVVRAHEAIVARGHEQPELAGMGTTITVFAVDRSSDVYAVGHVGDSRAYRFRDGRLTQLTRDDTWVQDRIEEEQLTPEQARRHPYGHLLTQCLGLEAAPKPHVLGGSVQTGDAYLLCTDGLVGMLEDVRIEEILRNALAAGGGVGGAPDAAGTQPGAAGTGGAAASPEPTGASPERAAVEALLAAANEAGGHDNITAALIVIRATPEG